MSLNKQPAVSVVRVSAFATIWLLSSSLAVQATAAHSFPAQRAGGRSQGPLAPRCERDLIREGDVTVHTLAAERDLACVVRIEGSLTISDERITALALPNLRTVTGDLNIEYTRGHAPYDGQPIALPALEHVGGNLTLSYVAPGETRGLRLDIGLDNLTDVRGDVTFALNTSAADLLGLRALRTIRDDLVVIAGSDVTFIELLPELRRVRGDVRFYVGNLLRVLEGLERIDGSLHIEGTQMHSGFSGLRRIGRNLELKDTRIDLAATSERFPLLRFIAGTLDVDRDAASGELALGDPDGLRIGGLLLRSAVQRLDAENIRVATGGRITLIANTGLCLDRAQAFVEAQRSAGWSGPATLLGNGCP